MWALLRALGPVDFKNLHREALLLTMMFIPLYIALVLGIGLPLIDDWLLDTISVNINDYAPLLMSFYFIMAPAAVGMVIGLMLIDEREANTILALQVTPITWRDYLLYRVSTPLAFSIVLTIVGYPLTGLGDVSPGQAAVVTILGACMAPQMALLLASLADNKVAGFALIKLINTVMLLPMVAYFVDVPYQWLLGILPPFWVLKFYWEQADDAWIAVVAIVYNTGVIYLLATHFRNVVTR